VVGHSDAVLSFVVLASPDGLSELVLDQVAAKATAWLPFEPAYEVRRRMCAERVALLAWALHPDGVPPGGRVVETARSVTAFGGYTHPLGERWDDRPWVHQIAEMCQGGRIGLDRCCCWGTFCLAHLSDAGGFVRSDPLSIAPLFRATGNGWDVVSNRPELAAAAIGTDRARDAMSVAWLLANEFYVDEATSFRGVRSLDAGVAVAVDAAGTLRDVQVDAEIWSPRPPVPYDETLAAVAAEATQRLALLASLDRPVRLSLSGGRDSRLTLAFALAGGSAPAVRFVTYESFPDEVDPDVEVATMLARELDLDHTVMRFQHAATTTEELEQRVRRHAFTTAAMSGAKAPRSSLRIVPFTQVGGGLGEMLSGPRSGHEVTTVPEAQVFLADRLATGLLAPDVRRHLVARQDHLVEQLADAGFPPSDLAYEFFLQRIVHNGMGHELYPSSITPPMEPLYNSQIPALCRAAGWHRRRYLRVHFDLMRAAAPRLAELPFADHGWPPEMLATIGDGDRFSAPPVVGPDLPRGLRGLRWTDHTNLFADYLLDPTNAVSDLLERTLVEDVLTQRRPLNGSGVRQLFNALGIAVWLAGNEQPQRTTRADLAQATR
jgi:hypothetical protein